MQATPGALSPSLQSLPPSQTATLVAAMASSNPIPSAEVSWEDTVAQDQGPTSPTIPLTFLLLSGKRKTFELVQTNTIAQVKERLLKEWPPEWNEEIKPLNSSDIRLLHLGQQLKDDEILLSNPRYLPRPGFPPPVIHLTVRPYPLRKPSGTSSLKKRGSLLRSTFVTSHPTTEPHVSTLEPLSEQQSESSCCCIVC